ncbi:hypothetical protein F4604DRAFT_1683489 [Suillus subluteus]|nr:hypothetical protein F4604DRAFT_1683489 [Suillus subluteus]
MDGEKIEALEDYLSTGSPADGWYKGLNSTQRTMWAALVTDFEKRWLPINFNFIRADEEATITKDDFCKLDALALESKRLPQSMALEAPVLLTSLDTFAHSPHLDLPPLTQTQTLTSFNTQSQQLYSFLPPLHKHYAHQGTQTEDRIVRSVSLQSCAAPNSWADEVDINIFMP